MWKSFLDLAGVILFLSFFLGLTKAAHHFTRLQMEFWTYIAFPIGAVIPWIMTIGILLWMFPGGADPAAKPDGFLPLAGYAAVFAFPIYIVAVIIGSFAFATGATVLSRLLSGATITSSLVIFGALLIFALKNTGRGPRTNKRQNQHLTDIMSGSLPRPDAVLPHPSSQSDQKPLPCLTISAQKPAKRQRLTC